MHYNVYVLLGDINELLGIIDCTVQKVGWYRGVEIIYVKYYEGMLAFVRYAFEPFNDWRWIFPLVCLCLVSYTAGINSSIRPPYVNGVVYLNDEAGHSSIRPPIFNHFKTLKLCYTVLPNSLFAGLISRHVGFSAKLSLWSFKVIKACCFAM